MHLHEYRTTWRFEHIRGHIIQAQLDNPHLRSFYQFGTWTCLSILDIIRLRGPLKIDYIYGFDSFEGLPDEPAENIYEDFKKYGVMDWHKGQYSSKDYFKKDTVEEAMQASYAKLSPHFPLDKILLVPGYWEDSLTDDLAEKANMGPAFYIDIDGDIYTSAYQALDFVMRNNIAVPGTYVGYDDWGTPGWERYETGESRAHKEISEKFNLTWQELYCINHGIGNVQKLFKLVSKG